MTALRLILAFSILSTASHYAHNLVAQGRFRDAHVCLLLYAPLGLITPLHFVQGNPDIPAFFYATIFTDALAGLAVVGFVVWSVIRHRDRVAT
jgi:hypothetical protein